MFIVHCHSATTGHTTGLKSRSESMSAEEDAGAAPSGTSVRPWEALLAAVLALDPVSQRCAAARVPIPPQAAAAAVRRCACVWQRGIDATDDAASEPNDFSSKAMASRGADDEASSSTPCPADVLEAVRQGRCSGVGLAGGGTGLELKLLAGGKGEKRKKSKRKAAKSGSDRRGLQGLPSELQSAIVATRDASVTVCAGLADRLCVVEGADGATSVEDFVRQLDAVRQPDDLPTPSLAPHDQAVTAADVMAAFIAGRPIPRMTDAAALALIPHGSLEWPLPLTAADAADTSCLSLFERLRRAAGSGRHPVMMLTPDPSTALRATAASPLLPALPGDAGPAGSESAGTAAPAFATASTADAAAGSAASTSGLATASLSGMVGRAWAVVEFRTAALAKLASERLTAGGWRGGMRVTVASHRTAKARLETATLAELVGRGWARLDDGTADAAPAGTEDSAAGMAAAASGPIGAAAAGSTSGAASAGVPPPMTLRVRGGGLPRGPGAVSAAPAAGGAAATPAAGGAAAGLEETSAAPAQAAAASGGDAASGPRKHEELPAELRGKRVSGAVRRVVGGTIGYVALVLQGRGAGSAGLPAGDEGSDVELVDGESQAAVPPPSLPAPKTGTAATSAQPAAAAAVSGDGGGAAAIGDLVSSEPKPKAKQAGRTVVVRFAMREVEAEVRGTKAPAVASAVRQRMQAGDVAEFEVVGGGLQGPWRAVHVRLPVLEAAAIEAALKAAAASALGKTTDANVGLAQPAAVRTARGPDGGPGFEFPRTVPEPTTASDA